MRIRPLTWILLGLALATAGVAWRVWKADPVRGPWCRVLPCPDVDAFDRLCAVSAEVELVAPEDFDAQLARRAAEEGVGARALDALAAARAAGPEQGWARLRAEVREEGAPGWQCPPLERRLSRSQSASGDSVAKEVSPLSTRSSTAGTRTSSVEAQ